MFQQIFQIMQSLLQPPRKDNDIFMENRQYVPFFRESNLTTLAPISRCPKPNLKALQAALETQYTKARAPDTAERLLSATPKCGSQYLTDIHINDYCRNLTSQSTHTVALHSAYSDDSSNFIQALTHEPHQQRMRQRLQNANMILWPTCQNNEHWYLLVLKKSTEGYHLFCLDGCNFLNNHAQWFTLGENLIRAISPNEKNNITEKSIQTR